MLGLRAVWWVDACYALFDIHGRTDERRLHFTFFCSHTDEKRELRKTCVTYCNYLSNIAVINYNSYYLIMLKKTNVLHWRLTVQYRLSMTKHIGSLSCIEVKKVSGKNRLKGSSVFWTSCTVWQTVTTSSSSTSTNTECIACFWVDCETLSIELQTILYFHTHTYTTPGVPRETTRPWHSPYW